MVLWGECLQVVPKPHARIKFERPPPITELLAYCWMQLSCPPAIVLLIETEPVDAFIHFLPPPPIVL